MRIQTLIIFTVIHFCSRMMGELIVPIVRTVDGLDWVINATIGNSTNIAIMPLKIFTYSILPGWAPTVYDDESPTITLQGRESVDVPTSNSRFTWEIRFMQLHPGVVATRLALTGDLLSEVQSIAVTQSTDDASVGDLVLMSNLSVFNLSCVPGSLMRIELSRLTPQSSRSTVNASASVLNVTAHGEALFSSSPPLNSQQLVAEVHPDIYEAITHAAIRAGARIRGQGVVSNCSATIYEFLPPIRVVYQNSGDLFLYPDDYMVVRPESTCELLLQPSRRGGISIVIDPLKIRGVNFRFSSGLNTWEFCEAARVDSSLVRDPRHSITARSRGRLQRFAGQLRRFLGCLHRC